MYAKRLRPSLKNLRRESVLIQAWKKTAAHIRQRSWTVDSLALDFASVNLPSFIKDIRKRLLAENTWRSEPLRIVPAPKNQEWLVTDDSWKPTCSETIATQMRPLAYVSLMDQVVATATMLCLADRVETLQGDTRLDLVPPNDRKKVVSYGNRLFCDADKNGSLRHRWGSVKLYREYYQDYRSFLSRPELVAESTRKTDRQLVLVKADLKQFYDRVRPKLMMAAIDHIQDADDDENFFVMAKSVLDWNWHKDDRSEVSTYTESTKIDNFDQIALPQGLVAAGFFANVVLLKFDEVLQNKIGSNINTMVRLVDACRYVDDLQILVEVEKHEESPTKIGRIVTGWLDVILNRHARGLELAPDKTEVIFLENEKQPLMQQRVKMNRIQAAVSGGHDLVEGVDLMDGVKGLLLSQVMLKSNDDNTWQFSPIPDVRDETVARFSASKFLTIYRSVRPLLDETCPKNELKNADQTDNVPTREELDQDAKVVSLILIERWIKNPSSVRVLLTGLDLWPDAIVLNDVLCKLREHIETDNEPGAEAEKRVAWYCLSEILRAGATFTGCVKDPESFPSEISLASYRHRLCEEAIWIVNQSPVRIPWYLYQQAILFLLTFDPTLVPEVAGEINSEVTLYWKMILFMRGRCEDFSDSEFATLAVIARRSFLDRSKAVAQLVNRIKPTNWQHIVERDPSFCYELLDSKGDVVEAQDLPPRVRNDLCYVSSTDFTLADAVLEDTKLLAPRLRNELSLLYFAEAFLELWEATPDFPKVVTPKQVCLDFSNEHGSERVNIIRVKKLRPLSKESLYSVPRWCRSSDRWRIQLGFLLRFILAGKRDFTRPVRHSSWRENRTFYRPTESHWYQRIHGMHSAQSCFGDDWLPITEWVETFLLALLRWPGCRIPEGFEWITHGIPEIKQQIAQRISDLEQRRGKASGLLVLPMEIRRLASSDHDRSSLRVCVAQTAIPNDSEFCCNDLTLDGPEIRRKHQNHLSKTLSAVKSMLKLRETHRDFGRSLDLLILPELSVHPKDVQKHLETFAMKYKTMILAGLTYERIFPNKPLVNSALWIIPEWSESSELRIKTRRQGKENLAPNESGFNSEHNQQVIGFRPCQWLIGYPWSDSQGVDPLWFTAAVCYDATDLALVTDLRNQSDVLAIPALNKDVNTFDQMALALHYHMFQLVILANNGQYGGSNAYWPKKDAHERQIFHFHGQSQANISFFEIDNVKDLTSRHEDARDREGMGIHSKPNHRSSIWKYPPAGFKKTM